MSEYKNPFEEALKNNTEYENPFEQYVNYDRAQYAQTLATKIENRVNKWLQNNNNFISNARYRAQNRSGYVSDSGEWLSTITTQKNNFDREAESIKNLLNEYKDVFDPKWVQSISSVFDTNGKTQADIITGFTEENSYWSQWENEDQYNDWVAWDKEQKRLLGLDVDATRKQADIFEAAIREADELSSKRIELEAEYERIQGVLSNEVASEEETARDRNRLMQLERALAEIKRQEGAIGAKYGIVGDFDVSRLKEKAANLRKDATYAAYKQTGEKLKNEALSANDFESKTLHGKTNPIGVEYVKAYLSEFHDDLTLNNPITDPEHEFYGGGTIINPEHDFYSAMSEEEKKILGYYIATDIEKAEQYINAITETVGERVANGYAAEADTWYDKVLFSFAAGTDQFTSGIEGLVNAISGVEEYIPSSPIQMGSGEIRQNIKDGEGFGNKVLGVAYDIGSTTANMLPSILVGMVNPVAGTTLMGVSAGGNAYNEMINLGYSKIEARAYGVMVGASEALLERFLGGISAFGGKGGGGAVVTKLLSNVDNVFGRIATSKLARSMVSEFTEESLQTILEPWFKSITTGMDYEAPDFLDVMYSGFLGALSAGLIEGVGGKAISTTNNIYRGHQIKKTEGGVDALVSYAETLPEGTDANKLASKVKNKDSKYNIGRLFNSLGEGLTSQNHQAIHDYLTSKGVQYEHASKIGDTIAKYVNGEKLTFGEKIAVTRNPLVKEALNVIKKDAGYSVDIDPETGEYIIKPSKLQQTLNANNEAYNDVHKALMSLAKETAGVAESTEGAQDNASEAKVVEGEQTVAESESAAESVVEADAEASESVAEIKNIASIENGKITYNLEDGTTSSNATTSNKIEGLVYESVTEMGASVDTANSILDKVRVDASSNGEQDLRARFFGIKEVYFYGRHGISADEISKHGFADTLTDAEREWAYNLGKKDRAEQTAKAEEVAKSKQKPATRQGENEVLNKDGLYYDKRIKKTSLNAMQKASVDVAKQIHKILGVNVHLFASYVKNGKRYYRDENGVEKVAPNGKYINGDIYLDINAGQNGEGIMLNTLAHELTHHIQEWSPEKYKKLCDFLMEQYGKKGVSVSDLVYREIAKAKKNGRDVSFDEAYNDVIANSMETMLHDGTVLNKLAQTDSELFNKIKTFVDKIVERIKALYANADAESLAGKYVARMQDSFTEIQSLFADALATAGENFNTATESELVEIDTATESVTPAFSERTWSESEYVLEREKSAEMVAEALGVSVKKAKQYIDDINSIAKMIADARTRLDYEASPFGSAFVSNVEYGGSFDFTTLCKKRRLFTGTFSEIQKKLRNTALTPDDILKIRNMMLERKLESTCGLCYVEGSRANMGKFAKEFIRLYKRDNPNAWIPDMADVNTPDGVESMKINHPEAYEQYEYFWNHYGKLQDSDPALFASQQKPKLYEARKEYKGEILKHFNKDTTVEKKNRNGGIRMQSFSDFEIIHLIDTMQIIMDMSRVGLAGQAYTKVPEFARAFGNTGLKINLSLIAKGVDADGNLIFDDREGMPHETAFELRNQYSANVGTIIVTFTDEQLMAAMADDRIDFIIPFHRSQWKKGQYGAMGLPKGTKDYTFMQNEKLIKQTYHEYRGRMVKDKASNYMPNEYWDFSKSGKENAEAYLKMCAENNKRPKFYKLLDYDGKGTYSLKKDGSTDGYWKLLIDFKMYDNKGKGSPQKTVVPNFNMDESKKMLDEYKGGHQSYPVAHDVVDAFVEEYTAGKDKTLFSERDSEGNSLTQGQQEFFKNSKVRDANGNLLVVRHGTNADFNIFDFTKSGKNGKAEGYGFYFSDDPEITSRYGDIQKEVYLNITKPLYNNKRTINKAALIKLTNALIDFNVEKYKSDGLTWQDSFISNYVMTYDMSRVSAVLEFVNQIWDFNTTDQDLVFEIAQADGKMYDSSSMKEFYNVLTASIGYDGIIAEWKHEDGTSNVYVTFESNQSKNTTNKNPTENPDIRYSERDYSYEALVSKPDMVLTTVGGKVPNNRADVIVEAKKNAASVGKMNKDGSVSVYVKDVDADIILSRKGLEHGLDRRFQDIAPVTLRAGEIIANSIKINELTPSKEEAEASYVLIGAAKNSNGNVYVVRSVINKFSNELDTMEVLYAINAKKDSTAVLNAPPVSTPDYRTAISIAELLEFVNNNFPDVLPEPVLRHFGHKARPEGKLGESALFSERDPEYAEQLEKLNKTLETENAKLREDKQNLKELLALQKKVTNGKRFTQTSVIAAAKKLMRYANAKGEAVELARILNTYYEGIVNSDNLDWDDVTKAAKPVVDWLKKHTVVKTEVDETAMDIRRYLKKQRVKLTEEQKSEAAYTFDGYNNFRKKAMGYMTIAEDATNTLEGFWQDLSGEYPDYFDSDVKPAEMPKKLIETMTALRDGAFAREARYEYEESEAMIAQDLLREVYNSYWDVSTLYTVADKAQKEINLLKAKHGRQMNEAREHLKDTVEKLKQDKKDQVAKVRKQYQGIVKSHEDKLIAKHQEQRERAKENRTKTEMRHKIKKVVNDLNRLLLKGNKESHVKIGLQPAVAAALEAINFDTVAAEQRLNGYTDENGKYHKGILQKIAEATDADVIAGLEKTRDLIQSQGDAMNERLDALRKAYANIQNQKGDFPDYYRAEAKLIEDRINGVIEMVGDTPLRFMNLTQLTAVHDLYTMVLTTVRNANKVFKQGKVEDLQANASSVMMEIQNIKKLKEERSALGEKLRGFVWNELTPFYAFNRIGSKTLTGFFWELTRGQNTYATDLAEAHEFQESTREKYGYKKWDTDKTYEFKLEDGRTFQVSLKQMMSIYAYSKRKQALDHMSKGGFFFNDKSTFRKKGKLLEQIKSNEEGYCINENILNRIKSSMTEEQIKYVDEMQAYLTDMGKKGNEVTRVIWGIDIFNEAVYFPLRSVKDFIYQSNQPAQESSLKNDGMTKETKPHASNPIVLENFDDVWASHVERMSQYHGFVLPIDNLNKILNYGTWANTASVSVSTMLSARFGNAANEYLTQFIRDLNGSVGSQGASNPIIGMVGKFKKTAVAASASVVVQQPTAVVRALSEIDAKYFVGKPHMSKEAYEQLKKYAPIAIIKEIGGFDAGSGRQAKEWLNADTYTGIDKAKRKIDDASMWAAGKADEIGWLTIWNAVKRETVLKHTNLAPNSEEFLKKAGERFTEVIVKTQVYDSTLSRSGYMRSKSDTVKMATAFMGEPTLSFNGMFDAVIQAKRGAIPKGKAIRTIASTYASMMLASAAASLIYAMRDDDDDESYGEKYFEAFGDKVIGDINPLSLLPFVKDIISIFDGWEVERTDMAIIQDIYNAWNALDSDTKSPYRKVEDLAGAIAAFFGLPVKNVMRTGREIYNFVEDIFDDVKGGDMGGAFVSGVTGESKEKTEKLYDAIISGDEARIEKLKSQYKDEASYESAVTKALRENDERIKEAAEAYNEGDIRERDRILAEIVAEGYFDEELVAEAITAEVNALKTDTEEDTEEEEDEATSIYKADDINVALESGDKELALEIIDDLVKTKVANGMEEDKAKSSVRSSVTSHWKPLYKAAYQNKDAEEMKRIRYILFDTGLYGRQSEVVDTCQGWIKELAKEKNK